MREYINKRTGASVQVGDDVRVSGEDWQYKIKAEPESKAEPEKDKAAETAAEKTAPAKGRKRTSGVQA